MVQNSHFINVKNCISFNKTTCTKFLFPQCQFSVFMQLFYIYRLCRNLLEKVKLHAGNNEKLLFHVKLHLALWSCMTACHAGTAQRLVKTTILSIKRPLECDPPRGTSDDFTKFLLQKFVQTRSTELSLLSFRTVTPSACEYSRICSLNDSMHGGFMFTCAWVGVRVCMHPGDRVL